ncbi:MAG: uroporphyrinogen decarboxylase (URO-D) [Acidobacteria bacterium]|nr:uroporphyrinogen decarboxylase (URO-D) [Acidobacteriota bacterium]
MNLKEAFLSVMRNEKPVKWMGYGFEAFPKLQFHCISDPISVWDILQFSGPAAVDNWGGVIRFLPEEGDPGWIPIVNDENKVIKDITKWRDYVNFPDIPADLDWSEAKKSIDEIDRDNTLIMVPTFRGLLERAHCLMPFEEVMIDLYEEPEHLNDFFAAYTDWKLKAIEQLIDNLKPDVIHSHDDWGAKTSLFVPPKIFRELFKPHYKRMYDYIKKRGVLIQHHSDSFCMGLENDMVDLGIDMWQGVLPSNDIVQIQKNTKGKLLLMGGIDQGVVDRADATEDEIRGEVRRAIDTYAPGGAFLPCIPSLECINTHVTPIVIDECNRYGAEWLKKQQ